ncbi:MAG: hypothetical protein VX871_03860, partial [Pseudomonadota bacterium]|nr:hypothetical protein [Pseudomonadota bacterium]
MTPLANQSTSAAGSDHFLLWLSGAVVAAHLAIVGLLPGLTERFQLGDRAWDRSAKLDELLAQTNLDGVLAILFRFDAPGDYILFLPAYALAGPAGVIAQNVLLLLVGLYYLHLLCETWFSTAIARLACITWLLLPATTFHPHAFVSEAICNPLLIAATWYAARMLAGERAELRDAV